MMDLIEDVKGELIQRGMRDECMVKECDRENAEAVEILALDPIDHEDQYMALCDGHMVWANDRNELAKTVREELRERRKELGEVHYDRIQELARPDREVSDAVLKGEYETLEEARRYGE